MAQTHVERELKFEAAHEAELPDVDGIIGGTSVRSETVQLRAVYYDTSDRHLQRNLVTLRRRSGGPDAGWHLKLPAGADHTKVEIQTDGRSSTVPRELSELVKGIRLGQRLTATARLDTTRTRHEILDPSGELIAEVAEDDVSATPLLDGGEPSAWREVEVELGPAGDDATLKLFRRALKQSGFGEASYGSKYARAVGEPPERDRPARLAGLVDDYLQQQYQAIRDEDARMRLGENRVHKLRVAVRRTRSTIRVFSDLFEADAAASLDTELRWFAEILGRARDLDVVHERLTECVETVPAELLLGPVAADLESVLASERANAARAVEDAMRGRRHQRLLQTIDSWRTAPPRTDVDPKASALSKYVDKAGKKARKRLNAALESGEGDDFHRARKAMKRYRYAAELAEPHLGKSAAATAAWAEGLQDELGELQDTVTSSAVLLNLARRVGGEPRRSAFSYGLLYGLEQKAADDIRRGLAKKYG
jgi:CHAD domain-containing protein